MSDTDLLPKSSFTCVVHSGSENKHVRAWIMGAMPTPTAIMVILSAFGNLCATLL
eukprot:CAMPEP_0182480536 /NCGR_PEP_ID=MMETSP1319-20130603/35919_1 /TAXON_ID=172717 /ORGANISM="Bolidomonas pacifica, Strain RCC208" /LENGTH=54 /DNA_ID=CAMNT_0024682043 /DNA_START=363 /DNA_END=527 /DNA_ORIENTATION=-